MSKCECKRKELILYDYYFYNRTEEEATKKKSLVFSNKIYVYVSIVHSSLKSVII